MRLENRFLLLLIFGSILIVREGNCQRYSRGGAFDQVWLQAACALQCSDELCRTNCTTTPKIIRERDEEADANATLVCRDVTFIVLAHNPGIFVIERRSSENGTWSDAVESNGTQVTLPWLSGTTPYQFRLSRVFEDGVSQPEVTEWYETMSDIYEPLKVPHISLPKLQLEATDPFLMRAEISFTPAEDRSCFYDILCQDSANRNILIELTQPVEFNVTFPELKFGREYTVSITARTKRDIASDKAVITFTTPTCLDIYENLTICEPAKVEGINATLVTRKIGNIFDVSVTWEMPKFIPDLYELWVYPITADANGPVRQNVSGTITEAVFLNVKIVEHFDVFIRARSQPGPGPTTYKRFTIPDQTYHSVGPKVDQTKVEGINATVTHKFGNIFDVSVTWEMPESIPDSYDVRLYRITADTERLDKRNVFGTITETVFTDVTIVGQFDVVIRARPRQQQGPISYKRFIIPQQTTYTAK